jgi:hypothetical protein
MSPLYDGTPFRNSVVNLGTTARLNNAAVRADAIYTGKDAASGGWPIMWPTVGSVKVVVVFDAAAPLVDA